MKKVLASVLSLILVLSLSTALAESTVTFSWWGGDSRHEATIAAVDAFNATAYA